MTDEVIETDAPEIPQYPDGVYFHMPEDHYHAQKRFRASGIISMMASECDFWAGSWMNQDRDDTATDAQLLGRAFHTARLEPELLTERFVRKIEQSDYGDDLLTTDNQVRAMIKKLQPKKEDYPEALHTDTDVKKALKELGQPQSQKGESAEDRQRRLRGLSAGVVFWQDIIAEWEAEHGSMREPDDENALDRAKRLRSYGYEGPVWVLEQDEFEAELNGRTPLPAKFWDQITADIDEMKVSPVAQKYLTGGKPEVSILWTDESVPGHPVKMMCRIDYLRPDRHTDVKTFDNPQRKPVKKCIRDQFQFNGYYIQAVVYHEATEVSRAGKLNLMDAKSEDETDFFKQIVGAKKPLRCTYVFQQKGGVPNVRAAHIQFSRHHASFDAAGIGVDENTAENVRDMYAETSLFVRRAEHEVATSIELFARCMAKYGEDRKWYPLDPEFDISDDSFRPYFLEEY